MTIIVDRLTKGIVTILINRPYKRNALDLLTFKSLLKELSNFESDDEARIAIIGGVGGNFCAGYDLNEIINRSNGLPNISKINQMLLPLEPRLSKRKITIAAIEGYAAGLGYELALRCDFRVADRDSKMGFLNRRFGIPIMNGGSVILPELVGRSIAMDLIATGKALPASEALNFGNINYLSDIGCSMGKALSFARCLIKFEELPMFLDLEGFYNHKKGNYATKMHDSMTEKLQSERQRALNFLEHCGPRECVAKFLDGYLCRHGNFDLGNSTKPEADVSL